MRIFTLNPIKAIALAICCLIALNGQATTYTAVASGWFTATGTWQGGLVPAYNVNADTIIIPTGITVKLSQNLMLTSPGALRINGVLSADTAATDVILASGFVDGVGTIAVDSVEMDMTSGFNFTGTVAINKFATRGTILNSGATFNIAETLYARAGTLLVPSGNMNLANNAWIVYMGGSVDLSSTNINPVGHFHIRYWLTTSGWTTSSELAKAGLKDVEVDVPQGASVLLSSDMVLNGALKLTTGILDLNGHDLIIDTDGIIAAGGVGLVSAAPPSSLIIQTANTSPGILKFTAGGNTVKDLHVKMGNSFNEFSIGSELNVATKLTLQSGKLLLHNNELIIGPTGGIAVVNTGGEPSYVVPGQNGSLRMTLVGGTPGLFFVGTANNFAPAWVMPNNVPSTGTVGVTVHPGVFVNSTSGEQIGTNQPVVNATWYVTGPVGSNINIDFEPMWHASMEVNGFNPNTAYVGRYVGGKWDTTAATAATAMPNGRFSLRRNNIKGFGAFAVLDQRAKTTDVKTLQLQNSFTLYPNPATDRINISLGRNVKDANGIIYDATGRMMKMVPMQTGTIDITDLPAGRYQLKITGAGYNRSQTFLKL